MVEYSDGAQRSYSWLARAPRSHHDIRVGAIRPSDIWGTCLIGGVWWRQTTFCEVMVGVDVRVAREEIESAV